jgi:stage II sporulation protein AA (anti-sigma F factor antagonist)
MSELATVEFEERDGVFVARLKGEIDMTNADELSRLIGRSVSNAALGIVLDLSGVMYLDSAGIRLLFELGNRLRQRGQRIGLAVGEEAPLRKVLRLTNVAGLMPVFETVEQARARVVEPEP